MSILKDGEIRRLLDRAERAEAERDEHKAELIDTINCNRKLADLAETYLNQLNHCFHGIREAIGLPDDSTLSWEQLIDAVKMQRLALRGAKARSHYGN